MADEIKQDDDGFIKEGSYFLPESQVAAGNSPNQPAPGAEGSEWVHEANKYTEQRRNPASDAVGGAAIGALSKPVNPLMAKMIGRAQPAPGMPASVWKSDPRYGAVEKWGRQMHAGDFFGGKNYQEAYKLGMDAREAEKKAEHLRKLEALFEPETKQGVRGVHKYTGARGGNFIRAVNKAMMPEVGEGAMSKFMGLGGQTLGRMLGGANAAFQGSDAYNRYLKGDYPGMVISGIGAIGSGASLIPTPMTRVVGTGVGLGAEGLNWLRDKYLTSQAEPERKAEGGLVGLDALTPNEINLIMGYFNQGTGAETPDPGFNR